MYQDFEELDYFLNLPGDDLYKKYKFLTKKLIRENAKLKMQKEKLVDTIAFVSAVYSCAIVFLVIVCIMI